jgi:hypothetical protein
LEGLPSGLTWLFIARCPKVALDAAYAQERLANDRPQRSARAIRRSRNDIASERQDSCDQPGLNRSVASSALQAGALVVGPDPFFVTLPYFKEQNPLYGFCCLKYGKYRRKPILFSRSPTPSALRDSRHQQRSGNDAFQYW